MALLTADTRAEFKAVQDAILTPDAVAFISALHREFNPTRRMLLARRQEKQHAFNQGLMPGFLPSTKNIRESDWQVAPCPADLADRRVEITGPAERKMMINALNSGAKVFMADLEDALSPTWENIILAQENLKEAVRGTLELEDAAKGKHYRLGDELATLLVRPRGWHLDEKHLTVDGDPISASLFDFGLYMFHNAHTRVERGSAPYFYLPKLESHLEARLWNEVFNFAQDYLELPRGTIRATVLVETIHAAFEMDEILYELREHISGLNAGRWDYIFSTIKAFHRRPDMILPDRSQVTMTVPFMHAYTELMVQTCHKRGAHAIGGMAAFIPNRRDADVTENALAKVSADKHREANQGCDGTWVAHPDLIPTAKAEFDAVLGENPNQVSRQREDVSINWFELLNTTIAEGKITEAGVRLNIRVALQYLNAWLCGTGAAAINNLMEDAATAEISRAQLWHWLHHECQLEEGGVLTLERFARFSAEEQSKLSGERLDAAAQILDALVRNARFEPFLTVPAYDYLD